MPNKGMKKKSISKSFRFTEEEWERIETLVRIGQKRDVYAKDTDVFKELIGLNVPHALTEQEIQRFRKQSIDGEDRENKSPPKKSRAS